MKNDLMWDERLGIKTEGVDYSAEDSQNYGYDPTPYAVLEELIKLDFLNVEDVVLDYGCGCGRVGFFLESQVGCRTIGIDHSQKLLDWAHENLEGYGKTGNIDFVLSKAEDYCPREANRFYFFNPFSTKVFRKVLERIGESLEKNPREILIFFYYSTIEYKLYLPTEPRLELIESVGFDAEVISSSSDGRLDVFRFNIKELE